MLTFPEPQCRPLPHSPLEAQAEENQVVLSGSSPCPSASQSLPAGEAEMWPQGLRSSGNFRLRLPSPTPTGHPI